METQQNTLQELEEYQHLLVVLEIIYVLIYFSIFPSGSCNTLHISKQSFQKSSFVPTNSLPRGVLGSHEILSQNDDVLSPKLSEEKQCLDDDECKRITHQMNSNFEIEINALNKLNSENLEKGNL